jgi:hypothetical protein
MRNLKANFLGDSTSDAWLAYRGPALSPGEELPDFCSNLIGCSPCKDVVLGIV